MNGPVTVACVQAEPAILDRAGTIDRVAERTAEAAGQGAELVVFPETFVPVYPSSAWAKAFAGWADPRAKAAFALLHSESLAVPGPDADRLGAIAREHGVMLVVGVNELDPERPGTLYNSLLYYSAAGELVLHHRKLVPTNHERLIWGQGDGRGLRAIETRGRPHRRADLLGELHAARPLRALRLGRRDLRRLDRGRRRRLAGDPRPHRAGVARVRGRTGSLPDARRRIRTTSRCARSSRAATSSAAAAARFSGPDGAYLAGPLYDEEGILYAELDPARLAEERQRFDPAGHYHRPDVFSLSVSPSG